MVSWLPHLVIPALVALAFLAVLGRRRILLWAPLAWAPDMDYVLPEQHRAVTHSLLIPMILVAGLVVLWRRRDPEARFWEYATRPGAPGHLLLAAYYLASHIVMDVFQGGVVLLWPIVNQNLYIHFQILLDTSTNTFQGDADAGTFEGAPPLSPLYTWVSTRDMAYLGFFALLGLVWLCTRLWRRATGRLPPPLVVERHATPLPPQGPHPQKGRGGSTGDAA